MKKNIKIVLLSLAVASSVTGLFGAESRDDDFKVVQPAWAREKLTAIVEGRFTDKETRVTDKERKPRKSKAKDAFLEHNTYDFPLINTIAWKEARVDVGLFVRALSRCSKEDLFRLKEDGTVSGIIFNTQDGYTSTIFHKLAIDENWYAIDAILGVLAEKGMTAHEWKAFAYYKGEEFSSIYETIATFNYTDEATDVVGRRIFYFLSDQIASTYPPGCCVVQ